MLLRLTALAAIGYGLYRLARNNPQIPARAAYAPGEATDSGHQVRNAGPSAMRTPPATWSAVDQASDESFPASDAPAR